jgi:hypothetical protein
VPVAAIEVVILQMNNQETRFLRLVFTVGFHSLPGMDV